MPIALIGRHPMHRWAGAQESGCTVLRVIDGDTIECEGGERVRLILIDTPELSDRPLGSLAREVLTALAPPGTELRVELDAQSRDRYRRMLAYLYLPDGRMLNEELVRRGYATVMVVPPNVKYVDLIRAAARAAREERVGLWGLTGGFEAPDPSPQPAGGRCDASYPDVCIPPPPPDLDCADIPYRRFRVTGSDPHRLDGDRDGIGCNPGEPRSSR